jgi:FkbM family methyltransferase
MSHFLNTLSQIASSESVGTLGGFSRHLGWQIRRLFRRFPCELRLAASRLCIDQPCGVGALINAMGKYDYNNMSLLQLVLSHGENTFIDVGANIGSYTLLASELPGTKVISIEPHPETFSQLVGNVRLNGRSNVTCLNLAISARDGEVFLTNGDEPSLNRVVSTSNGVGNVPATIRVPCRRLDGLCRELALHPDLVKIDVEGHQSAVLDGLLSGDQLPKLVFIEDGEQPEICSRMHAAGYIGPLFVHFARRLFSVMRQKRPEDSVYVHPDFLPSLQRINFELPRFDSANAESERLPIRTVYLTNFIPPYVLPVLQKLRARVRSLDVFVSTAMEPDRHWEPVWGDLQVTVQKTITSIQRDVYKEGFERRSFRHFPYDSLWVLYRLRPDVIFSLQLGLRTLQAAAYRLANPSCRLVVIADLSERTEKDIGRARTLLRRALLSVADAVVVNGGSGKRYVQRLGVPSPRIIEVPFTGDLSIFQAVAHAHESRTTRRLVYTGQWTENKGLKLLLSALSQWGREHRSQNCEVSFIGDGPLAAYLREFPFPTNVSVKFLPHLAHDELARQYADTDLLVLPTLLDPWALVVNEALAAGLPVLGSIYSQAVEELVREGVNGWTFRPDDPREFQDALTRAFSTPPDELDRMRNAARDSVRYLIPAFGASRLVQAIGVAAGERYESDQSLQARTRGIQESCGERS